MQRYSRIFNKIEVQKMLEVNSDNFDKEVMNDKLPVIVDFWADWCGPCKQIAPIFEELSKEYKGKLKFVKLNVDEHTDVASQFNVMNIPTSIIFRDGEEVDRIIGNMPKQKFKDKIDSMLD